MKKLPLIFLLLVTVSLHAQSQLVARVHFLGASRIAADTNATAFAPEFSSNEARALESEAATKLSAWAAGWLSQTIGTTVPDGATKLRPLIDDLQRSEWIFEQHADANGQSDVIMAVQLDDAHAQTWQGNLAPFFAGAKNHFDTLRSQRWLILYYGVKPLATADVDQLIQALKADNNRWLTMDIDWPRLTQLVPALRGFDFPRFAFQVVAHDGNFQIDGKLSLSQPLPSLPRWHIPTNTIHAPFISFTAARGIGPWLGKQDWFRPYLLEPQPEQMCIWALPDHPYETFAIEPVPDANAALVALHKNLSTTIDWQNHFMTPLTLSLTNDQISVIGIPFYLLPYFQTVHDPSGDFLLGGFFPNTPRSKPWPAELLARFDNPNLVFYHWEITGDRLKELPQLTQLMLMTTRHLQLDGASTGFQWIARLESLRSASVTTVTETSPTELSFSRKSPTALTAIELFMLADWIESPKFPALDLRAPERKHGKHAASPAAPPANPPN